MKTGHCLTCGLSAKHCPCDRIRPIHVRTQVSLVLHALERKRASNSGKLLCQVLPNSRLHVFGDMQQSLDLNVVAPAGMRNILLYPVTERIDPPAGDEPINLIIPDGNWKQAGKIAKKLIEARLATPVALPYLHPSRYRLRRAVRRPEGLATFEAAATYLGHLEGRAVADELLAVFELFVNQHLLARCKFGLMDPAFRPHNEVSL